MRYTQTPDDEQLREAGLGDISKAHFNGGDYDVILHISPLGGYSENYDNPPDDPTGALARVVPREGCAAPVYICVGDEGATNFPKDPVHDGFKKSLVSKG